MRLIAALFLLVAPLCPAWAQQPSSITLACNGSTKLMTAGDDIKPEPLTNIGIIVDFADRAVNFEHYRIPIESVNNTQVAFRGQQQMTYAGIKLKPVTVDGSIDRVTGAATIQFTHDIPGNNSVWHLICKPATRLF